MAVERDAARGTWTVQAWYRDWSGARKKKTKRGFKTKAEAKAWERDFLAKSSESLDMTLEAFFGVYREDVLPRVKASTWATKEHIVRTKVLPLLGDKPVAQITPADIVKWENTLISVTRPDGSPYSQTYLRTVVNQASAIFNHAMRFYGLPSNPVLRAGKIGSKRPDAEMLFWTKGEYLRFSEAISDKPESYHAFELLYWCGIREGELLALTPESFDFDRSLLLVRRTYQRVGGKDVLTSPKTRKSVRDVLMPAFLAGEMEDYLATLPGVALGDRVFPMTKYKLAHEMARGCKASGVKRIRIHDLRHSHASLLIDMGFSPLAIADRLGHETAEVTMAYAHLFPSAQAELAEALQREGEAR